MPETTMMLDTREMRGSPCHSSPPRAGDRPAAILTGAPTDLVPAAAAAPGTTPTLCNPAIPASTPPSTASPTPSEGSESAASSANASDDTAHHEKRDPTTLPVLLAHGLRRLSQWAHMSGWSKWSKQRLTPTQLKIMGLLATRAQGMSLTEVAREFGATASTTCDSTKALKHKGLVTKLRDPQDARQHILLLTPEGRSIADEAATSDPLLEAFAGLTVVEQEVLQVLWMKMIHALEEGGAMPPSRMCVRCQFFQPFYAPSSDTPHMCLKAQQALAANAVRFDCDIFEAAGAEEQKVLWEAFVGGTARRARTHELSGLCD